MGPRNRIALERPSHTPHTTNPSRSERKRGDAQVCGGTPKKRHDLRVEKSLCSQLLLHKEEGWQTTTGAGLQINQQMDKKEPKRLPTNTTNY